MPQELTQGWLLAGDITAHMDITAHHRAAGQLDIADLRKGQTANKWKVLRDACAARELLGLKDRALAVLDALLTFYPDTDLSEDRGLVVFPSNEQLSVRARGISERTLRRYLAILCEVGLIECRDSPNGKCYTHRDSWRLPNINKVIPHELPLPTIWPNEIQNPGLLIPGWQIPWGLPQ